MVSPAEREWWFAGMGVASVLAIGWNAYQTGWYAALNMLQRRAIERGLREEFDILMRRNNWVVVAAGLGYWAGQKVLMAKLRIRAEVAGCSGALEFLLHPETYYSKAEVRGWLDSTVQSFDIYKPRTFKFISGSTYCIACGRADCTNSNHGR